MHGLPKTDDPKVLASWIIERNRLLAPVDLVAFGTALARKIGGMKKLADKLIAYTEDQTLRPSERFEAMKLVLAFLQKTYELYPTPSSAEDMDTDQLASCLKHLLYEAGSERALDNPGDAFGD